MSVQKEFKLPDIGEGISEGEILRWLVKEGDYVKKYQPVVEVMTAKVNVEIPCPYEGKIVKLMAQEGEVVPVGKPLLTIEVKEAEVVEPAKVKEEPTVTEAKPAERAKEVLATPAVRRLARELGVDLAQVKGTGPGGRITEEDVRKHAMAAKIPKPPEEAVPELKERIPLRGIRRSIAEKMASATQKAALVTLFDEADVTNLVNFREKVRDEVREKGISVTYLPFIIKALIPALKEYPIMNATFDDEKQEIVIKKYYNIGLATDTEQGLLVPVIKSADKKSILELARESEELVRKAREGRLELKDVTDGTFSITNYGAVGGVAGTPIPNYPEIAILGVGRISKKTLVKDGEVKVRDVLPLSLTFDHRVTDGATATRFLIVVKRYLENPELMLTV